MCANSPSRGCVLTGRNHHSIGLASITETSTGYPGYNGILPFDKGMLSEMLAQKGYNTFAVGKWHLTPPEHMTPAGPYDRWPIGRGFERYYGFMGGETNQWYPELTYDNHEVEQPKQPEEGYHLSIDLADKVRRQHDAGKLTVRERIDGLVGNITSVSGTTNGSGEFTVEAWSAGTPFCPCTSLRSLR